MSITMFKRVCQVATRAIALSLLLFSQGASAADPGAATGAAASVSASSWPAPGLTAQSGPRRFVKDLKGTFNRKKIAYRATLEETILTDRNGKPATSIFTTSFVAIGTRQANRPVVFVFNGGPGGASNALMFGALGPKRMAPFTAAAQSDPATPVGDNPATVLDSADLIFIDPPETGFGRPLPGTDPKIFRSNDGDSFAVAQFILHWLDENKRFGSKVFIAGESYGTHRAVMLARDLRAATPSVEVAGLVLISQGLTYNGPSSRSVARLPDPMRAITHMHDVTPLAWYHGLIDNRRQTLGQAIAAARMFEETEYATALLRGNRLSDGERAAIAAKLEQHTGLPASYFLANNLRVKDVRRDLLASRGLALGQFDGRETEPLDGILPDEDRDWEKAFLGLTRAMERYVEATFGNTGLGGYRTIVPDPYGFEDTWTYIKPPQPGLDVVLDEQLRVNAGMRVMLTIGIFDTTSSMGGTEALIAQMPNAGGRVSITYYAGGHMLYSDESGMKAFNSDIRTFVSGGSLAARPFPNAAPAAAR